MKKQLKESPVIQANRTNSKEVQALISEFPNLKIEDSLKIKDYNAHCYVLLALSSKYNAMNGKTAWTKQVFTKTVEAWNSLPEGDKQPARMASAQRMVVIHNPTLEEEETTTKTRTASEPVELTEEQKEDIAVLKDGGASLKEVAKQLNLRQKDVQAHYESLA